MDCVVRGVAKSRTQLSDFYTSHTSYLELQVIQTEVLSKMLTTAPMRTGTSSLCVPPLHLPHLCPASDKRVAWCTQPPRAPPLGDAFLLVTLL